MDKVNLPATPFIPARKEILLDDPTTRMEDGLKTWAIFYKLDWRLVKASSKFHAYEKLYYRYKVD